MKKFMSLSEISISLGINSRATIRYVHKLFPGKIKRGSKPTLLDKEEVSLLKNYFEAQRMGRPKGSTHRDNPKEGFISARVSKTTEDYFRENKKLMGSGSISALILEAFPTIYGMTVNKIKALFSREELLTILTSFKGRNIRPENPGASIRLEPMKNHQFKNFNFGKLTEKYLTLSYADRFIIELWANKFWNGVTVGGVRNTTEDPEEYIK